MANSDSSGESSSPKVGPTNPSAEVGIEVNNAEFIAAVFPQLPSDALVAVCSKPGDPTQGGWFPMRADTHIEKLLPSNNNYVNSASIKPLADGTVSVKGEQVAEHHFLLLDDVGTKVDSSKLNGLKPTWETETSPGNSQMGFRFETPLAGGKLFKAIQNAVIAADLCDPGANGAVRWARLPVGINGKEKHRDPAGKPYACRVKQWNPTVVYTVSTLVDTFKLKLVAPDDLPENSLIDSAGVPTASNNAGHKKLNIEQLRVLLNSLDPNMGREKWITVLMAVSHETGGSAEGFELIDAWSRGGKTYPGSSALLVQWKSFRPVPKPYTAGTLITMAKNTGADAHTLLQQTDEFKKCETVVVTPSNKLPAKAATETAINILHPLGRYSASRDLHILEKNMVDQKPLLGNIALLGQAMVMYAQANTGKTLIVIHLIIEAVKAGRIDPSKVFYINMDDNSSGLLTKCRLAQEYGFHMLADGHQEFQAKDFRSAMTTMISTDTAKGVVVILDTLKKFVNTMDKASSSEFASVVRQFCLKGGTVIALAHANKKPGPDGKPVYSGTTDIVDDFDCAYTLSTVTNDVDHGQKLVEFTNIKRRGNVAISAAYSYSSVPQASYDELVLSVQEVDINQLVPIKQAAEVQSDLPVIAALEACIAEGINTKMKMIDATSKRTTESNRNVLKVIEKYTGDDPQQHRWRYAVGARGAQKFALLERTSPATDGPASPKP